MTLVGTSVPFFHNEAIMQSTLKQHIELRIRILEMKLTKSIPANRANEIRGEVMGLKWVLERI